MAWSKRVFVLILFKDLAKNTVPNWSVHYFLYECTVLSGTVRDVFLSVWRRKWDRKEPTRPKARPGFTHGSGSKRIFIKDRVYYLQRYSRDSSAILRTSEHRICIQGSGLYVLPLCTVVWGLGSDDSQLVQIMGRIAKTKKLGCYFPWLFANMFNFL